MMHLYCFCCCQIVIRTHTHPTAPGSSFCRDVTAISSDGTLHSDVRCKQLVGVSHTDRSKSVSECCLSNVLSLLFPGEPYCSVQFYIVPVTWDLHKYTLKVSHVLQTLMSIHSHCKRTSGKSVKRLTALVGMWELCARSLPNHLHVAMRIGPMVAMTKCRVVVGAEGRDQIDYSLKARRSWEGLE